MIFNVGGGGAALNFSVVGNPKPENPRANTVWVDSDNITGWAFSATEPEEAQEGTVWFPTGNSSTGAFNALKKNNLTICPLAAKQLENGAWVKKTSQIYQNGWVDFMMYLYDEGDLCAGVTGGYVTHLISGDYGDPAVELLEDRIKITTAGQSQSLVRTRDKIDIANISRFVLNIDRLNATVNGSEIRFFVTKDEITSKNPSILDGAMEVYQMGSSTGALTDAAIEMELNVSALSEPMYVYVMGYSNFGKGTNNFCVRKIRGE